MVSASTSTTSSAQPMAANAWITEFLGATAGSER